MVLSVHRVAQAASGEHDLGADQIFSSAETEVFTKAVALAEKAGQACRVVGSAGADPGSAWCRLRKNCNPPASSPAFRPTMKPAEQGKVVGEAWEQLPPPRPSLSLDGDARPEPIDVLQPWTPSTATLAGRCGFRHRLWLELIEQGRGRKFVTVTS